MNLPRRSQIWACLIAAAVSSAVLPAAHRVAWSAEPATKANVAKPRTVRLLTVGNSFSRDAMEYLDDLVAADGNVLILGQAVIGGSTMAQHLEKAQLHERDPKNKIGLYSTGRSLKDYLLAEPWDVVTMQQASIKSHDSANYHPSAGELRDYIKKYAPQSRVVLHETWAYRVDDPRFSVAAPKPGEPKTQQEMYAGLSKAYRTIAEELTTSIIPVGDAFWLADNDPQWGYRPDQKFDVTVAKPPALPDQKHSLHVGLRWLSSDGKQTLKMDGHHASTAGRYLAACVFYAALFDVNVVDNTFVPPSLEPAYAKFLRETARTAVANARAASLPTVKK